MYLIHGISLEMPLHKARDLGPPWLSCLNYHTYHYAREAARKILNLEKIYGTSVNEISKYHLLEPRLERYFYAQLS